ncbi:substrate-binding domain-containing protein [Planctomycetota bacterium]|nr:substrate-binding domain-containing protein [Planctomycetota bacterium]
MQKTTRSNPKHKYLFESLLERIESGEFAEGDKLPTEGELLDGYQVSRTTVIRALKELENAGHILRRQGAGSFVKQQAHNNSKRIGIITPRLQQDDIFAHMQQHMMHYASQLNWQILASNVPTDIEDGKRSIETTERLISHNVQGVIFVPHPMDIAWPDLNTTILNELNENNIPVVLLDRDIVQYPKRSHYDIVSLNHTRSGYLLAQHLLAQGCERILFLGEESRIPTTEKRLEGANSAFTDAEITMPTNHICHGNIGDENFLKTVLDKHQPDGIICNNDYNAALCLKNLLRMGIRVPDQIKIAGFDNQPLANLLPVPLTTIEQPTKDIAHKALSTLRDRMEKPNAEPADILISGKLIVRESTSARH